MMGDRIGVAKLYEMFHDHVPNIRTIETVHDDVLRWFRTTDDELTKTVRTIDELIETPINAAAYADSKLLNYLDDRYVPHEQTTRLRDAAKTHATYKFIHSVSYPKFIRKWLHQFSGYFTEPFMMLLARFAMSLDRPNTKLSKFLYQTCISILMQKIHPQLPYFYDDARCVFLSDMITTAGGLPQLYDSCTGRLFFSNPLNVRHEQISSRVCSSLDLMQIPYMIVCDRGRFYKARGRDKKRFVYYGHSTFEIPNHVQDVVESLVMADSRKIDLNQIKAECFAKALMAEDMCMKSYEGTKMNVPLVSGWQIMGAQDVRRISLKSLSVSVLYSTYQPAILMPILQAIWS